MTPSPLLLLSYSSSSKLKKAYLLRAYCASAQEQYFAEEDLMPRERVN